jgi:hypothetical protein
VTSYRKIFTDGSLRPIHGKITILPADRDTQGPRRGLLQVMNSQSGSRPDQIPFCGFMANVGIFSARMFLPGLMVFLIRSGRGEERPLVC